MSKGCPSLLLARTAFAKAWRTIEEGWTPSSCLDPPASREAPPTDREGAAAGGGSSDPPSSIFQVITPFRKLILCAENRKEMEDWIGTLKSVQKWEANEVAGPGMLAREVGRWWLVLRHQGERSLLQPPTPPCPHPPHSRHCRPPSSTWSISLACTTGTPAPTPAPPSATSAGRPCLVSPPTASPAKVSSPPPPSTAWETGLPWVGGRGWEPGDVVGCSAHNAGETQAWHWLPAGTRLALVGRHRGRGPGPNPSPAPPPVSSPLSSCVPFPLLVCKFKAHKRCAVRATNNCKWTTLASIGNDIVEDEDGVTPSAALPSRAQAPLHGRKGLWAVGLALPGKVPVASF